MKVGIIDYGVGNFASVMRALEEIQVTSILIKHPDDIKIVDKLILPGVGNFADCANMLAEGGWIDPLRKEVYEKDKPLLGICLGMQLLGTSSTEGTKNNRSNISQGLNLIPGRVENLKCLGCNLPIPHVGWNEVISNTESYGLLEGIPDNSDFYFVHSFAFVPDDASQIFATTNYGIEVTAIVKNRNVWGTQFHPEKSSRVGLRLLNNFIQNSRC